MTTNIPGVHVLDENECWALLEQTAVGRLAVDVAGQPDIFPINYTVNDESIVFRSAAGTKLAASVLLHHVAFEIDGYEPDGRAAWSVVIKGRAHQVLKMMDVFDAEDLPLFPWVAFPKPNFVRITPTEISGRRFEVVDDVAVDSSLGWQPTATVPPGAVPEPGAEHHPGAPMLHAD